YEATATALGGGEKVHPFVADITDAGAVDAQIDLLTQSGLEPSDVIHCSAGGLEPVLRDLVRLSMGLRRVSGAELDRAHAAAMVELAQLSIDARDMSMLMNFTAPSRLLARLAERLPGGATITFYTSLWSSMYPHPQVPAYYRSLAESKRRME